MLLCVVAPSPSFELEDGSGADETGVVVVDGCKANNASCSLSLSPANDSDASESDDCPLSAGVTLGVVVMIGVDGVGVASAPRS